MTIAITMISLLESGTRVLGRVWNIMDDALDASSFGGRNGFFLMSNDDE